MTDLGRASWQQFSVAVVFGTLLSCSSGASIPEPIEDIEPGATTGELAIYIADFDDGTTETRFMLRNASGDEQKLVFHEPFDLPNGTRLHVWGTRNGDALDVSKYKPAASQGNNELGSQSSPLIGVPPETPHIVCPVLVTINGGMPPANITIDTIQKQFHYGPSSVNAFYVENSYGKNSITGTTYGPIDYAMTGCGTSALAKALTPMIPQKCDQYSWVMVPRQTACGWAGLASSGTPAKPSANTWYNASIGCVVTVQEPGHNYGMNHSSSMTCSNGWFSDDLSTCTHSEYGDRFDPMGGGCRHMNVYQKQYEQWFGGCNAIRVTSSGTFNLLPTERPCDGVQSIQVVFPGGKVRSFNRPAGGGGAAGVDMITSYYLEYRTSVGLFDTGMTPQVLVHVGVNPQAMAGSTRFGSHSWIVDASATAKAGVIGNQPGMVAGGSFTDPAGGLKVTVVSLDPEKAVIQVDYDQGSGAPTCLDNTQLTPPGSTTCVAPASVGDAGAPPPPPPTTGAGGAGRDGGAAGAGGGGGAGGVISDAGPIGSGGQGGSNGSGGGAPGGSAGAPTGPGGANPGTTGPGGSRGNGHPPSDSVGGCSCRITSPSGASDKVAWIGLSFAAFSFSRRRRRRV
jgi:MYXO-CTERM domain-containing protein